MEYFFSCRGSSALHTLERADFRGHAAVIEDREPGHGERPPLARGARVNKLHPAPVGVQGLMGVAEEPKRASFAPASWAAYTRESRRQSTL